MIELNIFTFIIILLRDFRHHSTGRRLKYFSCQSIASVLILFALLQPRVKHLVGLILLFKIGVAPLHFWFISMSKSVSPFIFIWISVPQKILPICIIYILDWGVSYNCFWLLLRVPISTLNLIIQFKPMGVLAGSRVFSSNWVVVRRYYCLSLSIKFLLVYLLLQCYIIIYLGIPVWGNINSRIGPLYSNLAIRLSLLIVGGLPPGPLFFIKIEILDILVSINSYWIAIILIVSSSVCFFGYININMLKIILNGRIKELSVFHSYSRYLPLMLFMIIPLL